MYGKCQPLQKKNHLPVPTEDTALLNSELLCSFFRIFNLPKILIRKNTVLNFNAFSSEFWLDWGGIAGHLAWSGDQPWPCGWWILPIFGVKRGVGRTFDPMALHYESLTRPQSISKLPNIVSKQTLSYGKLHSTFSLPHHGFSHSGHSGLIWEYFPVWLPTVVLLIISLI